LQWTGLFGVSHVTFRTRGVDVAAGNIRHDTFTCSGTIKFEFGFCPHLGDTITDEREPVARFEVSWGTICLHALPATFRYLRANAVLHGHNYLPGSGACAMYRCDECGLAASARPAAAVPANAAEAGAAPSPSVPSRSQRRRLAREAQVAREVAEALARQAAKPAAPAAGGWTQVTHSNNKKAPAAAKPAAGAASKAAAKPAAKLPGARGNQFSVGEWCR
jgi:hypothetical protein